MMGKSGVEWKNKSSGINFKSAALLIFSPCPPHVYFNDHINTIDSKRRIFFGQSTCTVVLLKE